MGVVQRQSVKNAIVQFVAMVVGMVSVLFIYSLDNDIYGYATFLYGCAALIVPFASIGVIPSVVKHFPKYKQSSTGSKGFLSLLFLLTLFGFGLFLSIAFLFQDFFYDFLSLLRMDIELIKENINIILLLTIILIFVQLLTAYISNFQRIVVPAVITNFGYKLFMPSIVLAYYFKLIDRQLLAYLILAFFAFSLIALLFYAFRLKALKFGQPSFLGKENRGNFLTYMFYSGLNGIGNSLAFRIDTIMISIIVGTSGAGLYAKILVIANVLSIPSIALNQIVSPIVSRLWEEKNLDEIHNLYKRSSINLFLIGVGLFVIIYFALDGLIAISSDPSSFENGKLIFVFLGLSKMFDLVTSINQSIITYSEKYRFNLLFLLILGVNNLIMNYYLIDEFNVVGAAMATAFSLFIFNVIKLLFIWLQYGMSPFSRNALKVLFLGVLVFAFANVLPDLSHPFLNSLFKCAIIVLIYVPLSYFWNISSELNKMLNDTLTKLKLI